jgi:very-short-patch-repair endonuclease
MINIIEDQTYDKQKIIELEQPGFQMLRFRNNDTLAIQQAS